MESQGKTLESAGAIIDAAGGTSKVARRFGVSPANVHHWRLRGFPSRSFTIWQDILKEIGVTAPPSLWKQSTRK
jgi:hypothetical protein